MLIIIYGKQAQIRLLGIFKTFTFKIDLLPPTPLTYPKLVLGSKRYATRLHLTQKIIFGARALFNTGPKQVVCRGNTLGFNNVAGPPFTGSKINPNSSDRERIAIINMRVAGTGVETPRGKWNSRI